MQHQPQGQHKLTPYTSQRKVTAAQSDKASTGQPHVAKKKPKGYPSSTKPPTTL